MRILLSPKFVLFFQESGNLEYPDIGRPWGYFFKFSQPAFGVILGFHCCKASMTQFFQRLNFSGKRKLLGVNWSLVSNCPSSHWILAWTDEPFSTDVFSLHCRSFYGNKQWKEFAHSSVSVLTSSNRKTNWIISSRVHDVKRKHLTVFTNQHAGPENKLWLFLDSASLPPKCLFSSKNISACQMDQPSRMYEQRGMAFSLVQNTSQETETFASTVFHILKDTVMLLALSVAMIISSHCLRFLLWTPRQCYYSYGIGDISLQLHTNYPTSCDRCRQPTYMAALPQNQQECLL